MPNAPSTAPGALIGGRYQVEAALGRGGMASVYRVRDTRTGKPVALKRSGTRAASKTHRRRVILEREYQILAQLTHPRIIDVYDYGVDTDGPYYTMELLDGADLDKSGPLPWREACAVLRDIASSLAILHSRGVIHRDVSARNVRRTADGRAKLIDFGAMASMGQPSEVVGTAAFMAPEVLQMQSLDGRADLFSLGALGHYLLLGRHAFPVRKLSELRDQWRTRPISPSKVLPEVPPALGQLIVQLLSLDRAGRPQNAAEVMERLCTVAGLPVEELGEISRAYLTMPTLVGRDDVLMTVRSRMLSLVRNDGDTLWIEGAAGSGRSRLLDACVLEGKLVGANLLRADASDGPGREWAVARRLTSQLFELFPLQALTASQFSRSILGQVVEELQDDEPQVSSLTTSFADRSVILRELRDFVLAATRGQRVILAVDDADRIDEPSAALLAAIADKVSRQSLILVLAVESGDREEGPSPLRLCRTLAQRIELKPLEAEQTEAVLGSVFGQVTNLPLCAGRIHDLTHGNPRATMELAQHLVDRGLARYEAGSWLMPSQLSERDLPRNLFATLETRLAKLSPDAREFAEVMCLTDGYALPVESYVSLTVHRDRTRIAHAVDELVAARVMLAATEHDRFTQRGFIGVLRDLMPAPRQRALHSRLADFLAATGGDAIRRAEHLFLAERPGEAIVLLSTLDLVATAPPTRLLERALEHAVRDELLPARVLYGLRLALMMRAPIDGAIESFRKCLPAVLKQLEWDTGLTRYYELGDVPEAERLTRALAWQHQHYLDSAERDQVYPVSDAIRELSRLCAATSAMAISFLDLELVESLPIVEPLVPLSPALRVITQIVEGAKEWVRGRGDRALALYLHVLARLAEPDRAGLTEGAYVRIHASMQYGVALMETQLGLKGAEERAKILEANRSMRVAAWRIRMLIQLNQGNLESARKCSRRAELLQLHGGDETYDVGTSVGFELRSCALAGDLLGVKAATDALVTLAQRHANWQPMLMLGQAAYRELQGDLPGALEFLLAGFALARPARHPVYTLLAASHVRVLDALGRLDEAVSAGESYLEICAREQLVPADRLIAIEFAHALGRAGQHARALAVIGSAIENAERIGMSGLPLGVMYEKRARIASMAQDIAAFDKFAELCAAEYRKGNNPALSARFTRMLEETAPPTAAQVSVAPRPLLLLQTGHPEETNTVRGRLFECNDRADRARCALTLLLQSSDSFQGYLYTVDASGVAPLASLPEQDSDRDMQAWLARWVRSESESNDTEDVTANLSDPPIYPEGAATHARAETETLTASPQTVVNAFSDASGVTFEAVLLIADRPEERRIAAVLAMRVQRGGQRRPPYPLLNEIAELMLEHGDAVGIAI